MAGADAALPPCQKASCIVQLSVSAGGLSAGVTLHTGPATTATLKVYRGAELVGQGADPVLRTAHSMTTTASLTPDTAYTWRVRVTEVSGHSAQSTGSVSTLHRRVTVQFLTDSVFDDSDSAGDFETVVAVTTSASSHR